MLLCSHHASKRAIAAGEMRCGSTSVSYTHLDVYKRQAEDALHIAVATVSGVDYLLTWNCRHIANPEIQRCIAEYLEQIGLFLPFICTPEELLGEENAE